MIYASIFEPTPLFLHGLVAQFTPKYLKEIAMRSALMTSDKGEGVKCTLGIIQFVAMAVSMTRRRFNVKCLKRNEKNMRIAKKRGRF